MKPVEQTILTPPDGNCFAACVASILELPIETVPNFRTEGHGWWHEWQEWLKLYNLALLGWASDDLGDDQVRADTLRGYSICTVRYETPRGGISHSVVCFNGEMVWNPHPLRDTAKPDSIQDWITLRVLDPSKVTTRLQPEDEPPMWATLECAALHFDRIAQWLTDDTDTKPKSEQIELCKFYAKQMRNAKRLPAKPEDERVRLVTMFTELYNCYTASKCHASDEGNREEFLRLKGMAEAYQDAARRIAEPLSIQPILGDKRVGEIRSRTPISDRYTTIGPTETQPCKSVDKHGTHTMCYHIHQYLEQADEDRRHLLSLLPVQPAASTPTDVITAISSCRISENESKSNVELEAYNKAIDECLNAVTTSIGPSDVELDERVNKAIKEIRQRQGRSVSFWTNDLIQLIHDLHNWLGTERTMHRAWRKRAEEAEATAAASTEAKCKRCNGTGEVEGYGGNLIYCGSCAGTGKTFESQLTDFAASTEGQDERKRNE